MGDDDGHARVDELVENRLQQADQIELPGAQHPADGGVEQAGDHGRQLPDHCAEQWVEQPLDQGSDEAAQQRIDDVAQQRDAQQGVQGAAGELADAAQQRLQQWTEQGQVHQRRVDAQYAVQIAQGLRPGGAGGAAAQQQVAEQIFRVALRVGAQHVTQQRAVAEVEAQLRRLRVAGVGRVGEGVVADAQQVQVQRENGGGRLQRVLGRVDVNVDVVGPCRRCADQRRHGGECACQAAQGVGGVHQNWVIPLASGTAICTPCWISAAPWPTALRSVPAVMRKRA